MNTPNAFGAARSVIAIVRQVGRWHAQHFRYTLTATSRDREPSTSTTIATSTAQLRCAVFLATLLALTCLLGIIRPFVGPELGPPAASRALLIVDPAATGDQRSNFPLATANSAGITRPSTHGKLDDWWTTRDRMLKAFRDQDSRPALTDALLCAWDSKPDGKPPEDSSSYSEATREARSSEETLNLTLDLWGPLETIWDEVGTQVDSEVALGPMPDSINPPSQQVCSSTDEDVDHDTDQLGTAIHWMESFDEATTQADQQSKLVFVLHVSGNFALPEFT